jgi:DNA-binding response OmpR family regulator
MGDYMSGIRILVAEDEDNLRNLIVKYLQNEGFTVLDASDGEEALDIWFESPIDLAVLDIIMPKINGWDVLSEIRKDSENPVILLTSKREESDRLKGFERGTDDYITKPFSPRELVMRVLAILKRTGKLSQNQIISLPGISINNFAKTVATSSGEAKLSAREYELLMYFIDNQGIALSRVQILERIWGYEYEGDTRVLDTTIKRLRKKLDKCGSCIKTLRGTGYRFEVE